MSGPTTSDRLFVSRAVSLIQAASERYAPDMDGFDQMKNVREELAEFEAAFVSEDQDACAEECADIVIAAIRLGTLISPRFDTALCDKLAVLDARVSRLDY